MKKRALGIYAVLMLLFTCLIARVYELSEGWFTQAAQVQSSLTVTAARARGTIYDCHGRAMVNTGMVYRLSMLPTPSVLSLLSASLPQEEYDALYERLQSGKPVTMQSETLLPSVNGLLQFTAPIRYTYPTSAQHILGYVDAEGHGVTGIERAFDEWLEECSGSVQITYTVDGLGKPLTGVAPTVKNTMKNAAGGVMLTLDMEIQRLAEEVAQNLTKGAIIVTEPSTGYIRAMVSRPSYRADELASVLEAEDAPLVNRAISNYNVGSVFKIASAAAALENRISPDSVFSCTGNVRVGNLVINCHQRLGHGVLDMFGGFCHSCNPYFIQLMQTVGGYPLYDMAVSLDFDRPLYLAEGLKTASAVLPSESELLTAGVLANVSFGQGALMATPVHIAQMVGAVVNGGEAVAPTLFLGKVAADGTVSQAKTPAVRRVFSEQTAATLTEMMKQVTESGTGKAGQPLNGKAGGKTGTAQTGWIVDESTGKTMVQSWFAGFFPANEPRYVVVVLAEDAETTGDSTSALFKEMCEQLYMHDLTA